MQLLVTPGREAVVVVAACAALALAGASRIPFYTRGEPREGLVAREILRSGQWLVPARPDDEPARKPPLYYWAAAAALAALPDRPELALRLPSAALGTAAVLGTWATARAAFGSTAGLPTALVLATSFEWTRAATSARVDMALAASLTAVLAAWTFALLGGPRWRWTALAATGAAFGTLAKGPVAIVLPALATGVLALARRDMALPRRLGAPAALGVAVLVAGVWYAAAFSREGSAFLATVARENWFRYLDPDAETGHAHGAGYLFSLALVGLLPWTPLLPLGFVALGRARTPAANLAEAWVGAGLVFFSFAASKRSVYLLPLYPAVALLVGAGVVAAPAEGAAVRVARGGARLYAPALVVLAALAAALAVGFDPGPALRRWLRPADALGAAALAVAARRAAPVLVLLALASAVAGFVADRAARRGRWRRLVHVLAMLAVAWTAAFNTLLHPAIAKPRSLRAFMGRVDRVVPAGDPLYAFFPPDPALRFYAPRELRPWPPPARGGAVHLLLWEDEWRRWRDALGRPLRPLAASRAEQPGRGHLLLVAPPPGRLVPAPAPGPTPPARGSERVVDAGEDRRALAAAADVDEADDLRPHHAAEPEAVDEVQVRDRRVGHPPEHLARLGEGRQLELRVHPEELALPDAGAELGGPERAVEVDEAVAPEPA
ncbi:MAG: hypothetical protein E6J70_03905 [Deltaproteobacteria bacterium]|nr:MAG: hypothetical protein E6J70_03905 [Deltaproteobacteria bacterium]